MNLFPAPSPPKKTLTEKLLYAGGFTFAVVALCCAIVLIVAFTVSIVSMLTKI